MNDSKLRLLQITDQLVKVAKESVLIGAELGLAASVFGSLANFIQADISTAIALSSMGVVSAKLLNIRED